MLLYYKIGLRVVLKKYRFTQVFSHTDGNVKCDKNDYA